MAFQIPEMDFQHLLAHTFPGFLVAITTFMLLDILSPINITGSIGTLDGIIEFIGFILLLGTVSGVIIDGLHHLIIESSIFNNISEIDEIKKSIKSDRIRAIMPTERYEHLNKYYYSYSEFFSNAFISILLFSFVVPFYILRHMQISWEISILIGISSLLIACFCLFCSYKSYIL